MKFDLSYPLDVLAEVATSLYWRLLAFAASIFFGVWLGASIAAGRCSPWDRRPVRSFCSASRSWPRSSVRCFWRST